MKANEVPHLFVWRDRLRYHTWLSPDPSHHNDRAQRQLAATWRKYRHIYKGFEERCPVCRGAYTCLSESTGSDTTTSQVCLLCGFEHGRFHGQGIQDDWGDDHVSMMRRMSINESQLAMNELGAHLKRRFSDIHALSPRRFELLVEDVFRNLGYSTRITKCTRDLGYDIVLVEGSEGKQIIVECKRYAAERKIGVGTVRQVLGVQLIRGFREAIIVTTSDYSSFARKERSLAVPKGYNLTLLDATDLLSALELYNTKLPPLQTVDFLMPLADQMA